MSGKDKMVDIPQDICKYTETALYQTGGVWRKKVNIIKGRNNEYGNAEYPNQHIY
jgi:hypothetical protein